MPEELAQPSSAFEPQALVGTTLDGRYQLLSHLATGGMGAVFKAQHVYMRKDLAIKVLRPDLTTSPDIVERFRREAEIAASLEHDHIVRVSDFGRSPEGYLFLVMELLEGESLFDRLRREQFLRPEDAVPVLWQICAALEAAHARGVVHRDLKPENVFLARTPSGREVTKILDFGIAKIADPASGSATQAGMVVGTPEYLAPEQAMGLPVDARADLYAVGLIAWRMLVGRHPFKADDPRSLLMMQATRPVPALSDACPELAVYPALAAAVARACAKEAADRPQSATALKDELAAALGPAFAVPRGATPAPPLPALSIAPGVAFDLAPPPSPAAAATPALQPSWSLEQELRHARLRVALAGAGERARAAVRGAVALVRRRRAVALGLGATALVIVALVAGIAWRRGRVASEAQAHLAAGRNAEARSVLERAIARRPASTELQLLLGRALHRIPGEASGGIDAYAAVLERGAPLDDPALRDLAADLGRERLVADRAARVLARAGEGAVPAVLRAARDGPGFARLRALGLARDLGAEDRLDRTAAYTGLLADPDCEVRRGAARRLGELGDRAALPRLRELAGSRKETRHGLFGSVQRAPTCGAPEAAEAVRRIEAPRAR